MAQIAIPVLLVGVAYLMSNDEEPSEGFSNIDEEKNQGNLLANENKHYYPNIAETKNNINNETTLSQHQDKYYLKTIDEYSGDNEFETLAGNRIKTTDINHNNMNIYYSSKTNGYTDLQQQSILDTYTGQGTYDIKKEEIAPLFKPETNMQNVYGNKNNNDFLQSRVVGSQRHANTKPWQEIKDTPGINMSYNEGSNMGLNNYTLQRDSYKPKTVDELRTSCNPKCVYTLDNHKGPAIKPVQRGIQGKIVKQLPDTTFANDNNLGMVAQVAGPNKHMQKSHQMLTCENRPSTSIEYYGARGSELPSSYVSGEYMDSHKQQLNTSGPMNMKNNENNPTNELNYGKDTYNALPNNRSTTNDSYFGVLQGMVSNVVDPLVKGLRHSKKTNITTNNNPIGYFSGDVKRQMAYNPNESVDPTNREMYENKLSMNHLNVQKQDATAYMNTRPLLNSTQRNSMNQSQTGPAQSSHKGKKNYQAQYNQRNQNKVHACDVKGNGNMSLFNNKVKMIETNKEICNSRQTPFYNPQASQFQHPSELLGEFTSIPQNFENKSNDSIDSSLLKAFKENPYTQSLQSVV